MSQGLVFYYVRTGNLRDLVRIPFARMLLIWLAFGVYMSLQPGVSLLGHLGGFVPGVVLGMFYEHRYKRELDIYHILAAGMIAVAIVCLTAFSVYPFTRGSLYAVQALKAYENDDLEKGDALLDEAKSHSHGKQGTKLLLTHLEVWRRNQPHNSKEFDKDSLRWPLTHPDGVDYADARGMPWTFLIEDKTDAPESLESTGDQP